MLLFFSYLSHGLVRVCEKENNGNLDLLCENKKTFEQKNVNIFLSINCNIYFGCSKEPSHWDGSFEYPKHMSWLRNKKLIFNFALLSRGLAGFALIEKCSMKIHVVPFCSHWKALVYPLTLCIQEAPKQVLVQIVKTQMKCSIMLHFIRVYTVCKGFKEFQTKEYKIITWHPLICTIYHPKFTVSNQMEESIKYTKG